MISEKNEARLVESKSNVSQWLSVTERPQICSFHLQGSSFCLKSSHINGDQRIDWVSLIKNVCFLDAFETQFPTVVTLEMFFFSEIT